MSGQMDRKDMGTAATMCARSFRLRMKACHFKSHDGRANRAPTNDDANRPRRGCLKFHDGKRATRPIRWAPAASGRSGPACSALSSLRATPCPCVDETPRAEPPPPSAANATPVRRKPAIHRASGWGINVGRKQGIPVLWVERESETPAGRVVVGRSGERALDALRRLRQRHVPARLR